MSDDMTKISDLALACEELGLMLSEKERAGFRAIADSAPPRGSTLARLLYESDDAEKEDDKVRP